MGGKTDLVVDAGMDGPAETVAGADGKKTIYLKSLGDSAEERLRAGVVLQHEAYRDGEQSGDQEAETLRAVTGHSEMAKRMLLEGSYAGAILSDMNLMTDLYYLHQGADVFASYAGKAYDSSADYWRVLLDSENNAMKVIDDGENDYATVVFEDGREVRVALGGSAGKAAMIAEAVTKVGGLDISAGSMSKLMYQKSGLSWNKEKGKWEPTSEEAKQDSIQAINELVRKENREKLLKDRFEYKASAASWNEYQDKLKYSTFPYEEGEVVESRTFTPKEKKYGDFTNHGGTISYIFSNRTKTGIWENWEFSKHHDGNPNMVPLSNNGYNTSEWFGPNSHFYVSDILHDQLSGTYVNIEIPNSGEVQIIHFNEINYKLKLAMDRNIAVPAGTWLGNTTATIGVSSGPHIHMQGRYARSDSFYQGARPTQEEMMKWFQRY